MMPYSQTLPCNVSPISQTLPLNVSTLPSSYDLTQIALEIGQIYQLGSFGKQSTLYKQIINMNGAPGRIYQAVRRLPAPAPDVIQRTFVVHPGRDVVDLSIVNSGITTQPIYQDCTVMNSPLPAVVNPKIVNTTSVYGQGVCQSTCQGLYGQLNPYNSVYGQLNPYQGLYNQNFVNVPQYTQGNVFPYSQFSQFNQGSVLPYSGGIGSGLPYSGGIGSGLPYSGGIGSVLPYSGGVQGYQNYF